jgi:hypothetical protein
MPTLANFEKTVLECLLSGPIPEADIRKIIDEGTILSYKYDGHGYFLSVTHDCLPIARQVCSTPIITGTVGDVIAGFVLFLENGCLTIDCYTLGEIPIPENFRRLAVLIEPA